jgi:hypothetical protein
MIYVKKKTIVLAHTFDKSRGYVAYTSSYPPKSDLLQ